MSFTLMQAVFGVNGIPVVSLKFATVLRKQSVDCFLANIGLLSIGVAALL